MMVKSAMCLKTRNWTYKKLLIWLKPIHVPYLSWRMLHYTAKLLKNFGFFSLNVFASYFALSRPFNIFNNMENSPWNLCFWLVFGASLTCSNHKIGEVLLPRFPLTDLSDKDLLQLHVPYFHTSLYGNRHGKCKLHIGNLKFHSLAPWTIPVHVLKARCTHNFHNVILISQFLQST